MTIIAGVLKSETTFKKSIRSGGSALIEIPNDGPPRIIALAEERATGQKYASGFACSLVEILTSCGASIQDIDFVGVSSCCEPRECATQGLSDLGGAETIAIGHHESHATLAFLGSGYDEALVAVSDGGGDVLDGYCGDMWWLHPREQLTFWHGTRSGGLKLLCRDFAEPLATGFGEFYRAVSYFLGWHGSRHASKVMALAAYGRRPDDWPSIFYADSDGSLRCILENHPDDPINMIVKLGTELGIDLGEPREPNAEILEVHRNLAALTQNELERAMTLRLRQLLYETGLQKICLAGGVALNVVANGAMQRELRVPVYVPPAPADDGQALGNALSAWWRKAHHLGPLGSFALSKSSDAELGPVRKLNSAAVSDGLSKFDLTSCTVFEYSSSAPVVARVLSAGSTVCVFQDRSEYGPRALGSRSILGDPRLKDGRALFNQLKGRDWFMPFAPSVGSDIGEIWFSAPVDSPFMSFAVDFAPHCIEAVRAVSSNDGTGRVQSVGEDEDSFIAKVVREFFTITDVPMVLNTSFNAGGHPIVETVYDALDTFSNMGINILALGRFLIVKSLSPELIRAQVMPKQFFVDGVIVRNGARLDLGLSELTSRECIRTVQEHTGLVVFVRTELPLFADFLARLRKGEKATTIRYRKGAVEIPSFKRLPLYETPDYGVGDRSKATAVVEITGIRYQIFGELTEEDAIADGFDSLEDMRRELRTIYASLQDDEWVTIYSIGIKHDSDEVDGISCVEGSAGQMAAAPHL
jgi:carbamoyltransferase